MFFFKGSFPRKLWKTHVWCIFFVKFPFQKFTLPWRRALGVPMRLTLSHDRQQIAEVWISPRQLKQIHCCGKWLYMKGHCYWRYTHFSLNHDYGWKGNKQKYGLSNAFETWNKNRLRSGCHLLVEELGRNKNIGTPSFSKFQTWFHFDSYQNQKLHKSISKSIPTHHNSTKVAQKNTTKKFRGISVPTAENRRCHTATVLACTLKDGTLGYQKPTFSWNKHLPKYIYI